MCSVSRYSVTDHFKAIQYVNEEKIYSKNRKNFSYFYFFYPFILFLKCEESASSQHQECLGNDVVVFERTRDKQNI